MNASQCRLGWLVPSLMVVSVNLEFESLGFGFEDWFLLPTQCPPNEMPHRMFIRVLDKSARMKRIGIDRIIPG